MYQISFVPEHRHILHVFPGSLHHQETEGFHEELHAAGVHLRQPRRLAAGRAHRAQRHPAQVLRLEISDSRILFATEVAVDGSVESQEVRAAVGGSVTRG